MGHELVVIKTDESVETRQPEPGDAPGESPPELLTFRSHGTFSLHAYSEHQMVTTMTTVYPGKSDFRPGTPRRDFKFGW
jgi:hypothetical protein